MEILFPHIAEWFRDKQEHFTAFAQADSRIEGWFKAELLALFSRLVANRVIEKFCKSTIPEGLIDIPFVCRE